DLGAHAEPVTIGQLQVHHRGIGGVLSNQGDPVSGGAALGDDAKILLEAEHGRQGRADHVLVVDEHHAQTRCGPGHGLSPRCEGSAATMVSMSMSMSVSVRAPVPGAAGSSVPASESLNLTSRVKTSPSRTAVSTASAPRRSRRPVRPLPSVILRPCGAPSLLRWIPSGARETMTCRGSE